MQREELLSRDKAFRCQILGRLISDCKYYLGLGNRNADNLWAKGEHEQIQVMKMLYESFAEDEKPDWISMDVIVQYEREMLKSITEGQSKPIVASEGICAIYSQGADKEKLAIYRTVNDRYINYYGWMGETLLDVDAGWSCSAGPFDSFERAEELLLRHRPKAVRIELKQ